MSRLTNALMGDQAFARGHQHPMLNLANGGQHGYAPQLPEWVSNQGYVRKNLIPILLEAPRFFSLMPDSQRWVDTLRGLVEVHCRSIEGLNGGLTVEFDEHPIGGAGEFQQEFTDVKRERSEPQFTFIEKYGMPITNFLYNWITYGMMDPDTKFSLAATLAGERPSDMLADWYTMSMMFIEPDPTHTKVLKCWITANMMPKLTGEIIGKRDLTTASELTTLNIGFTGFSQFTLGTNVAAQKILDQISLVNANPYRTPAFIGARDSEVAKAESGDGETSGLGAGYDKSVALRAKNVVPGI